MIINKNLAYFWLFFSFVGFIDATFLSLKRFLGQDLVCGFFSGCSEVTTSAFATVLSVPVAYLGVLFYLTFFLGTFFYLDFGSQRIFYFLLALSSAGFVFTLWLLYAQGFLIGSFCVYCLASAFTSSMLFLGSVFYFRRRD